MSRRHGVLALGDDVGVRVDERTMQEPARPGRARYRRPGVAVIGIVGKDWVVLDGGTLAGSSVTRGLVESGIRSLCRILALD